MLFFLIAIMILVLTYTYIGLRLIGPMRIRRFWKAILWVILIVFLSMAPVYMVLRHHGIGTFVCNVLPWAAYLSLGFFSFLFSFLVIRDVAFKLMGIAKKVFSLIRINSRTEEVLDNPQIPERRSFLIHATNLGMLGLSGMLTGYGFCNTRDIQNVVRVSVPVPNLPDDLEGFRIVQITDIHISPTLKRNYVQDIVEHVNRLNPDIVAFTGDLADGPVSSLRDDAAPLRDLSAVYGSYFVTGNHEYYMGVEAWVEEIDRLGLTVLLNEHQVIRHGASDILVAGITDYNAGLFMDDHISDPNKALSGAPDGVVKILLAHQPRSIFASAKAGFDLQISGHTHGGQFYPWQLFVGLQQPYLAGLYRHDGSWIYVSRGTGYWGPPVRLGAPSEISVIKLTKQEISRGASG